ncbi:hypothetical protein QBC39DRAFT_307446 [Podospora conica]|nr:hypothetical protein QBC39DRAFT_307446 [Schizothecium conicum]
MVEPKKRKLDGPHNAGAGAGAQPGLSAFAARQKLWGGASSPAPPSPSPNIPDTSLPREKDTENVPIRKAKPRSPIKKTKASVQQPAPEDRLSPSPDVVPGQDEGPREPVTPIAERRTTIHSTFRPNKKNYQQRSNGRVVLRTSEGERLVILGSYGIKVREGEVTLAGAVLRASENIQWVHTPHCHGLPVLRVVADALLELHPHPASQTLRQLAQLNPSFGKLWNESASSSKATFQIIYSSEDVPRRVPLQELVSPAEWNKKLAGAVSAKLKGAVPILFLCGPKSSGKSTFGKLLANRLVTDQGENRKKPWSTVAVLDLDPGQPEFGPPGVISLNKLSSPNLSPSFCHPALAPTQGQLRVHAIAAITPAQDPEHFIEATLDLFAHYRTHLSQCPLIINTPGWIQGTGLDILSSLVKSIHPTEVIYMSLDGPDESVDTLQSVCGTTTPFLALPSQPTATPTGRSAQDLRTMQTLSYFHLDWPSLTTTPHHPTWNPTPLTALRPWRVRYRGPDPGILGVLCYDHQPGPLLLAEAINGMILALVKIENRAAFRDLVTPSSDVDTAAATADDIPLISNPQGRTLDPRYSRLLGLVLVRGIDAARGELQVLTPLSGDVVAGLKGEEVVLVAGKFDTPSWAYAEDLHVRAFGAARAARGEIQGDDDDEEEEEDGEGGEEEKMDGEGGQTGEDRKVGGVGAGVEVPWVEMLRGGQKRSVGSRVWRVRRDLGRN